MNFQSRLVNHFPVPTIRHGLALLLTIGGSCLGQLAQGVEPEFPQSRQEQTVLASDDLTRQGEMAYLAFPALIRSAPNEVLISYKRGREHAVDPGALLEVIRFNTKSNQVEERKVLGQNSELVYQMGEWVQFPNGRIGVFADVQRVVPGKTPKANQRTGIE